MEIKKQGQVLDVVFDSGSVTYYIKGKETGSLLIRTCGHIDENSFRYEGVFPKKYGRGKMKNEAQVYQKLEEVEAFLKKQGYLFTT